MEKNGENGILQNRIFKEFHIRRNFFMSLLTLHLPPTEAAIADDFARLGFADQNELVAAALRLLKEHRNKSGIALQESAALYAEVYADDYELQELTSSALTTLPSEMPV
jgi:hypothetical protein